MPLLAVLPGTGGLTRVIDKRKVRRDHADVFCTTEEGVKGKRAVDWRLVDEVAPNSKLEDKVTERAKEFAAASKRNGNGKGIRSRRSKREIDESGLRYGFVTVDIDRVARAATIAIKAPEAAPPDRYRRLMAQGAASGRCGSRASWTMRSCTCASTSSRSRCSCSSRTAIPQRPRPRRSFSRRIKRTGCREITLN